MKKLLLIALPLCLVACGTRLPQVVKANYRQPHIITGLTVNDRAEVLVTMQPLKDAAPITRQNFKQSLGDTAIVFFNKKPK